MKLDNVELAKNQVFNLEKEIVPRKAYESITTKYHQTH